ncbi:hypothetical protein Q3G72_033212 [Acer saccharum]|nr:hypothetical protein Q3G72_033212 [Acer saccharum]
MVGGAWACYAGGWVGRCVVGWPSFEVGILFLKYYNINTNSGDGYHRSFPTPRRFGDVGVTKGGQYFLQQWRRPSPFFSPPPLWRPKGGNSLFRRGKIPTLEEMSG